MGVADYADTNYYQPSSDGPTAVATEVNGETVYLDTETGQIVKNLDGYTISDGDIYWHADESADSNNDGAVDPKEANVRGNQEAKVQGGHTTRTDALGFPAGPKATASNNFGYKSKPTNTLKAAAVLGSLVNPAIGGAVSMLSKGYNVANMDAVNNARKGLGLTPLTGKQMLSQAMKDNRGQIGDVNIGDNKYSVGFEALSPDNKTNLTYNEAKTREALARTKATETPAEKPAKAKSAIGKALDSLFGTDDPSLPDTAPTPEQRPGQVPDDVAAEVAKAVQPQQNLSLPENAPVPSSNTNTDTPSPEASIGLPNAVGVAPSASPNTSNTNTNTGVGLIGRPNNPGIAAGTTPDRLGRVSLQSVDFDKLGLNPAMAAQMKSFQKEAAAQNLDLSVDVNNLNRTAAQQQSIVDAGYSKTNNSYHRIGLAADISATKLNDKDQPDPATQAASRAIAAKLGLGTLKASFDPAHVQATVPGQTAASLMNRPRDAFGNIQLSPEEDLSVRNNSVPTPTEKPSTEVDRNYSGQGLDQTADASPDYSGAGELPNANDVSMPSSVNTTPHANVNLGTTPAALAAMGFTPRSASEKAEMARAISGELSQKSLKALASTDPSVSAEAKNEVGSMLASMENRAATDRYSGIANTLAPSQYNSLMTANLKTTNQNYANNKDAVNNAVGDYYSGSLPDANYGATNYHATAMANPPGWSKAMSNVSKIGDHTFGSLPNYSPSTAALAAAKAFSTMAGTQFSPGKAKDDASLGVYSGTPSANTNSVGSSPASSSPSGPSSGNSSSSSGSSSSGASGGGIGRGASTGGSPAATGGYASTAPKGATGGL